jgi:hypothetical protein
VPLKVSGAPRNAMRWPSLIPSFLGSGVPEYPAMAATLAPHRPRILGSVSEHDVGHSVHYTTVTRGTPIFASDGEEVGKVVRVLDNHREHILDGIVFEDGSGTIRFVDGPEVQRTFERAVELNIDSAAAAQLGPPERHGVGDAVKNSPLGRLFGR